MSDDARFQFIDTPPPSRKYGRNAMYTEFAAALKARPGDWAIWPRKFKNRQSARATTSNVNHGRLANFPSGEFEACTSGDVVYIRFKGGAS